VKAPAIRTSAGQLTYNTDLYAWGIGIHLIPMPITSFNEELPRVTAGTSREYPRSV